MKYLYSNLNVAYKVVIVLDNKNVCQFGCRSKDLVLCKDSNNCLYFLKYLKIRINMQLNI